MTREEMLLRCDVCGHLYQPEPAGNGDHRLELYGNIRCCDSCWEFNGEGWAPHFEELLLTQLQKKGIQAPGRNEKGFLPRN